MVWPTWEQNVVSLRKQGRVMKRNIVRKEAMLTEACAISISNKMPVAMEIRA